MRYFIGFLFVFGLAAVLLVQCGDATDLCEGVECSDDNQCTEDACEPVDGSCRNTAVSDATECDFVGVAGICFNGVCHDAKLCENVTCNDENECTDDVCNPADGRCDYRAVADGTPCVNGGGLCHEGSCRGTPTLRCSHARLTMSKKVELIVDGALPSWTLAKLEFFDGAVKLGETVPAETGFGIDVVYAPEDNGLHTLTARAYDTDGRFVTTDPITLEVDIRWVWARQFPHDAREIASDGQGAVYAVGQTKFPDADAGITKFNSNGAALWSRSFGDENEELAHSVDVDAEGNVYVGGEVYSYGASPARDLLLLKYDPHGNLLWQRDFGEPGEGHLGGYVAADASGAVYITSWAWGGQIGLRKYSGEGTLLWTREFGTGRASDVVVDPIGGVYVVGGGTVFDGRPGGVFVVKYDGDGNRLWAGQLDWPPETNTSEVRGAAVDLTGSVYVVGYNGGGFGGSPHTPWNNPFVLRFDAEGNVLWARQLDLRWSYASAVAVDVSSVYVVGGAKGEVGGEPVRGGDDTFLAQYHPAGTLLSIWLLSSENGVTAYSTDQGEGVAMGADGTVYVSGGTDSTLAPGSSCPCEAGKFDGFVAKHEGGAPQ